MVGQALGRPTDMGNYLAETVYANCGPNIVWLCGERNYLEASYS
jgi:hypothetical protein